MTQVLQEEQDEEWRQVEGRLMTSSQGRQNPPPANFQNHKKHSLTYSLTYNSAKPDEAHEKKEIVAWIDPRRP